MSGDTNILAANTAALSSAKPTAVIKLYEDKNTGIYSAANRIESSQTLMQTCAIKLFPTLLKRRTSQNRMLDLLLLSFLLQPEHAVRQAN